MSIAILCSTMKRKSMPPHLAPCASVSIDVHRPVLCYHPSLRGCKCETIGWLSSAILGRCSEIRCAVIKFDHSFPGLCGIRGIVRTTLRKSDRARKQTTVATGVVVKRFSRARATTASFDPRPTEHTHTHTS